MKTETVLGTTRGWDFDWNSLVSGKNFLIKCRFISKVFDRQIIQQ